MIICDIDECCAEFLASFIRWHDIKYKTRLRRSQFKTYDFERIIGCPRKAAVERVWDFNDSPEFLLIEPTPGAMPGVTELCKMDDVYMITNRPLAIEDKTRNFLRAFFPRVKDVRFTNGPKELARCSKADLAFELESLLGDEAQVVIEDDPENARVYAQNNYKVMMLRKRWNEGYAFRNTTVYPDWMALLSAVRALPVYQGKETSVPAL